MKARLVSGRAFWRNLTDSDKIAIITLSDRKETDVMRKTVPVLVILSVLLVFCLAGCQKEEYVPESADALWQRIDQTMSELTSVEMTSTIRMTYYQMGYRFERTASRYILSTQETHYSESDYRFYCSELSIDQNIHTVTAHHEGKIYIGTNDGTYDQKFCSVMTHEEYDQTQSAVLTDEIEISDCTVAEFSKGENGTWNLQFSGYTKKALDLALVSLSLTDETLSATVSDMVVRLTADSDFRVQKMEIEFLCISEGEITPEFSVVTEYSGYNTAVLDPDRLKAEDYAQVADVRVLNAVAAALLERQEATSGQFALGLRTSYLYEGKTTESWETDAVTYGRKNGAYYYEITAQMEGQSFLINYQNGEQTVTANEQAFTVAQTDEEAKSFIDGLIDSAMYNSISVTGIEEIGENVYLLTCEYLDPSKYMAEMGSSEMDITSSTQRITVTFQDGMLKKMESHVSISGVYSEQEVNLSVEAVVVFENTEAP